MGSKGTVDTAKGVFMNIIHLLESADATKKYFFLPNTNNQQHIEACLLYLQRHGNIICVSSQLGCSQNCRFCAAGSRPFVRNLSSAEIQEQIQLIIHDNPKLTTESFQVTYMGSGEPLANWDEVFSSIDSLRIKYQNLERVNISTICPLNALERFEKMDWKKYKDFLHFQFSLHFPTDNERELYFRSKLPPISKTIQIFNKISVLINDTYRINYIPFEKVNDSMMHAEKLAKVLSDAENAVLKISQMCAIDGCPLSPSSSFDTFVDSTKDFTIPVEIFRSDGTDINAGCGQFYNDSLL